MDEWLKTRNLPLHFISVAGLVYKGDEVLLIKSKRRGWEIPGGVVEQGGKWHCCRAGKVCWYISEIEY